MFWGLLLIIVGVGWLLQNLGYLSLNFWEIFWPAVVIAFGLSILLGKRKWAWWCWGPRGWDKDHWKHKEHHEHERHE